MNSTTTMSPPLGPSGVFRHGSSRLSRIIVIGWFWTIPFEHAPSFIHPLLSLPGLFSILLILLAYGSGRVTLMTSQANRASFFLGWFFLLGSIVWTLPVVAQWLPSFRNYVLAHAWLIIYMHSAQLLSFQCAPPVDSVVRALRIGAILTTAFALTEFLFGLTGVDLGSFIPRYSRQFYSQVGYLGGLRIRAFSYESANLAMFANVVWPIVYSQTATKAGRRFSLLAWLTLLGLTLSAVQILFLLLFVLYRWGRRVLHAAVSLRWRRGFALAVLLSVAFLLAFREPIGILFEFLIARIASFFGAGNVTSGIERNERLLVGLRAVAESPVFGYGYGGIFRFYDRGLNNFYLHLLIYCGLFALWFIPLLGVHFQRVLQTKNDYLSFAFLAAWAHLLFIGDFWLPQLIVPIAFAEVLIARRRQAGRIV